MTDKPVIMVTVVLMEDGLVERTPTWWQRVLVRLASARLDRALVDGAPPESGVMLAVHADRLVRPDVRRQLAAVVGNLQNARVPVDPGRLQAVRADLDRVTAVLAGPGPVAAAGVARLRVLLTDGTGPLFGRGTTDDLRRQLRLVVDALVG